MGIKGYVVCKLRLNVPLHHFPHCDLYVSWQTPEEASSSTTVLKPKTDKKAVRGGGIYFLPAGWLSLLLYLFDCSVRGNYILIVLTLLLVVKTHSMAKYHQSKQTRCMMQMPLFHCTVPTQLTTALFAFDSFQCKCLMLGTYYFIQYCLAWSSEWAEVIKNSFLSCL